MHDGWHVRYGGGELSTEWVTSGQAALLWHALTPTMHSTTLQRSRVTVPGLAAARGRPPLWMPTHLLRATLWAQTPLRRLPTLLRLAKPGPRRRWARMRLQRCNDTTPSAPRLNPRPV